MDTQNALGRLRAICSKTEKCPKDIRDMLIKWNFDGNIQLIVETLKEENFINDERFSNAFVNDKIKFSKWGKIKVAHHLKNKGINSSVIRNSLDSFSESEYLEMVNAEMIKKCRSLNEPDLYKKKQKLFSFGSGRGYEMELLYKITDAIL